MKYHISELIDAEAVLKLIEKFYDGWSKVCINFHKKNPDAYAKCDISDTIQSKQLMPGKTYSLYECGNGMIDGAIPICVDGEHVAILFTGQFLFDPPDMDYFKKQAAHYGFNEKEYLDAICEAPVLDKDKVEQRIETRTLELKKAYSEKMAAIAEA